MKHERRIFAPYPGDLFDDISSISSDAIDTYYVDACEQLEHLVGRLKHPKAQKLTHGEVEAVIHMEGMELLRRLETRFGEVTVTRRGHGAGDA
jgi:hypothetical protein